MRNRSTISMQGIALPIKTIRERIRIKKNIDISHFGQILIQSVFNITNVTSTPFVPKFNQHRNSTNNRFLKLNEQKSYLSEQKKHTNSGTSSLTTTYIPYFFLFQTLLQLIQSATLFDKKTLLHHVVNHKKEVRKTKMGTKKSSQTENLARYSAKKSPKVLQE